MLNIWSVYSIHLQIHNNWAAPCPEKDCVIRSEEPEQLHLMVRLFSQLLFPRSKMNVPPQGYMVNAVMYKNPASDWAEHRCVILRPNRVSPCCHLRVLFIDKAYDFLFTVSHSVSALWYLGQGQLSKILYNMLEDSKLWLLSIWVCR